MKYLRYGCLSISKNILFTFIMVLEVVALLVTTNVTIGSANNKSVLTRPFDDIVNKEGYYCFLSLCGKHKKKRLNFMAYLISLNQQLLFHQTKLAQIKS